MRKAKSERAESERERQRVRETHTVDCAEIFESRTVNHVDANANLCQMLGITQMFSSQHFASLFVYFGLVFFSVSLSQNGLVYLSFSLLLDLNGFVSLFSILLLRSKYFSASDLTQVI